MAKQLIPDGDALNAVLTVLPTDRHMSMTEIERLTNARRPAVRDALETLLEDGIIEAVGGPIMGYRTKR